MMVPKFNDIPDGKHVIAFHLLEAGLNKIRLVSSGRNVLIYLIYCITKSLEFWQFFATERLKKIPCSKVEKIL